MSERESVHVSRKTQSLYALHSDVTWYGCSVFVRYKALSSAYSQGERMTQGYEYQDVGVLGAILEDILHINPRQTAESKFYTKPPSPLSFNVYLVGRQRWG